MSFCCKATHTEINVNLFCQIRTELEQHMNCNLQEYKEFIDNEMLLILGQMDKATLIFDYVYLVGKLTPSPTLTKTVCCIY